MLENSLCFRFVYALLSVLQAACRESCTGRLLNRFTAVFRRWVEGSTLVRVFWVEDSLSLWHGSKTFVLFSAAVSRTRALLESFSLLLTRARSGSALIGLLQYYQRTLKASPIQVFFDIFLVFLAANLLIRLILQAYSAASLLLFSAAWALTFLLRFYHREIGVALKESRVLQLTGWFFTLSEPEDKR